MLLSGIIAIVLFLALLIGLGAINTYTINNRRKNDEEDACAKHYAKEKEEKERWREKVARDKRSPAEVRKEEEKVEAIRRQAAKKEAEAKAAAKALYWSMPFCGDPYCDYANGGDCFECDDDNTSDDD